MYAYKLLMNVIPLESLFRYRRVKTGQPVQSSRPKGKRGRKKEKEREREREREGEREGRYLFQG